MLDDLESKFGVETNDDAFKASILKGCLKVRVNGTLFYVPFGSVEIFFKMSLSARNDLEIFANENSDLFLL